MKLFYSILTGGIYIAYNEKGGRVGGYFYTLPAMKKWARDNGYKLEKASGAFLVRLHNEWIKKMTGGK